MLSIEELNFLFVFIVNVEYITMIVKEEKR